MGIEAEKFTRDMDTRLVTNKKEQWKRETIRPRKEARKGDEPLTSISKIDNPFSNSVRASIFF